MGGGGSKGPQTTIQKTELPPAVARGQEFLLNQAQRLYGNRAMWPKLYPGRGFALPSQDPYGIAGTNYLANYAQQTLPRMLGDYQGLLGNLAQAGDPTRDIFLNKAVSGSLGQLGRQFTEQIMPSFRASTAGSGAFGHSRLPILEAQMGERLAGQMGDISSRMYSDAYGRGLSAMAQAGQMMPMLAQMGMMPGSIYGNIAQQRLAEEQMGIDEARKRFEYEQGLPWDLLARLASTTGLGGVGGGGAGMQTTRVPGQGGGFNLGGAVGGGAAGLGLGSMAALPLFEAGLGAAPWLGGMAGFGGPVGMGLAGLMAALGGGLF